MVLMAIDHVRVYSGVPAGGPTAGVFFTRWVTHFCAPVFVFLAGTAAYLQLRRLGDKGALAQYLVTRGLMLVVLELTVIRTAWTFNVDYGGLILAGVIWMLGWCMVLLAAVIWLPTWAVGLLGFLIVVGQNLLPAVASASGASTQWLWQFLYLGGEVRFGESGPTITILYTLVPWIGVMALGYACGAIVVMERATRQRILLRIGLAATALFVIVGGVMVFAGHAVRRWNAGAVSPVESAKVSRVSAVPADDARPVDCAAAVDGTNSQGDRGRARHVRSSAAVLLPAAHSSDPRDGACRLVSA